MIYVLFDAKSQRSVLSKAEADICTLVTNLALSRNNALGVALRKKRINQNTAWSSNQAKIGSVPRITECIGWQTTVMHGDGDSDGIPLTGIRKKVDIRV